MLKKVGILLASILIVSALWLTGLEVVYARVLAFSTNVVLDIGGRESNITVERDTGTDLFRVHRTVDGRGSTYPQELQTIFYPTIIIIAWQVFLAFVFGWKQFIRSGKWNIGIFFLCHVIFLLLLTAYHSSETARFFYEMLIESFYVIAIVLIITDNIRNPGMFINTGSQKV